MKTLADAFEHTLQDIYYAENALVKALPTLARAAGHPDLTAAIEAHAAETEDHVRILEAVFASVGLEVRGEKCDAIDGLIKEADGLIEEAEGAALDAALIGASQAVEHYEIARYGTLREWARTLGHGEAHDLLTRILDQEKAANAKMTTLAVTAVNDQPGGDATADDDEDLDEDDLDEDLEDEDDLEDLDDEDLEDEEMDDEEGIGEGEGDEAPAAAAPKAAAKPKAAPKARAAAKPKAAPRSKAKAG